MLFVIPVIIEVHGHRFESYTLVSEIHENVDLVLGIKNIFKLEGVINLQDCCLKLTSRSLSIFPRERVVLKPKEQKLVQVEAPFIDEISCLAVIKILDGSTYSTMLIRLKFTCNAAILVKVNKGTETIVFKPKGMIGIIEFKVIRLLQN